MFNDFCRFGKNRETQLCIQWFSILNFFLLRKKPLSLHEKRISQSAITFIIKDSIVTEQFYSIIVQLISNRNACHVWNVSSYHFTGEQSAVISALYRIDFKLCMKILFHKNLMCTVTHFWCYLIKGLLESPSCGHLCVKKCFQLRFDSIFKSNKQN